MVYTRKAEPENYKQVFKKKLEEMQRKYTLEHVPFCSKCCYVEFEKFEKGLIAEIEQKEGVSLTGDDLDTMPDLVEFAKGFDFSKFAGEAHFDKVSVVERHRYDARTNKQTEVVDGYDVNYLCKPYKHGLTMFMVPGEYEKKNAKK